jgi:transposase
VITSDDIRRGIVIGVDAHKRTHTMVAVDAGGRRRGEKTVEATSAGHLSALRWAHSEFGTNIVWAVEDSRALTALLERDLLNAGGQRVIRVPTQLVARTRKTGRSLGKSDPIDALAAALAALREPDLPVASHEPWTRELKLLIDRRDDLVHDRTAMMQRLLWRVHELDPTYRISPGALNRRKQQDVLAAWLASQKGLVAELARDELADIMRLTPAINALKTRMATQVRATAPSLLALHGCGALTAARIIGESADVNRFKSEAAFARFAGLAPIPYWSGPTRGRLRSHPGGNRQLNAALHQIAMIQIKKGAPAEGYYRRRREVYDSHHYAIHGVKRRIARTVYARLRADHHVPVAAVVAELERRAQEWAKLLDELERGTDKRAKPASPSKSSKAVGAKRTRRSAPLPASMSPVFAELDRRADEWAAELARMGVF